MIRSLSLRSRLAAASTRASADPALARVDREAPPLEDRLPVARARLLPLARLLLLARLPLARVLLADFVVLARVLRDPLLEPVLFDPPLLACGMLPPSYELGDLRAPYLATAPRCAERLRGTRRIWVSS
jgi:hypothetical protein